MQGLHQIGCMRPVLVVEVEALDEAAQDGQQAALLLIIMQQPAHPQPM